jgi:small subunit ribosomal protein S15
MTNSVSVANEFKHHPEDSGSVEVQIVKLTEDIRNLTEHFKKFPKDGNAKRGLMVKVGRRNAFLRYLKRKNEARHQQLVTRLELR